jgi:nucleoid-associated protein YgaU
MGKAKMLKAPVRTLAILLGTTAIAVTAGYVSGGFDRFIKVPTQPVASQQPEASGLMTKPQSPAATPEPGAEIKTPAVQQPATVQPPEAAPAADAAAKPAVTAPTFDVVRAEPDGSLVIAGNATPGSVVEIIAGSKVLGSAAANADGDFAVVLDDPLPPGDYQIVLRENGENNIVAMSIETAIVSIPDREDGQVLALVEQPGEPSRLITVPEGGQPAAAAEVKPADTAAAAQPQAPATVAVAPATNEPAAPAQQATVPQPPAKILVKAVEIEGNRVFVAGTATQESLVRVFANDILLGETKSSKSGDFLVETIRDLAVGDYIVRADLMAKNGRDVVARAQVPFRRLEGEAVAAVAPGVVNTAPQTAAPAQPVQSTAAPAPQASTAPAEPNTASDATPHTAEPLEAVSNGVIIRRGDTLWRISRRVYGRGVRYSTIYLANQEQISDPNRIWPGQVFSVPGKTSEGENADMDAIADQKAPKS